MRRPALWIACFVMAVPLLCWHRLGHPAENAAHEAREASIWRRVKRNAEAAVRAGDRRAFRKQLGKLTAQQLLKCGEQFCAAVLRGEEGRLDDGGVVTAGLMLYYHQKKVGLEATLLAVGSIVASSDNELWVFSSLEWLHSLKKKTISATGMHAIAQGALRALSDADDKKPLEVKQVVLKQVSDDDIWITFALKDRAVLRKRCEELTADAKEPKLRDGAAMALSRIEEAEAEIKKEIENCKDPKRKDKLKRLLYGPQEAEGRSDEKEKR